MDKIFFLSGATTHGLLYAIRLVREKVPGFCSDGFSSISACLAFCDKISKLDDTHPFPKHVRVVRSRAIMCLPGKTT